MARSEDPTDDVTKTADRRLYGRSIGRYWLSIIDRPYLTAVGYVRGIESAICERGIQILYLKDGHLRKEFDQMQTEADAESFLAMVNEAECQEEKCR